MTGTTTEMEQMYSLSKYPSKVAGINQMDTFNKYVFNENGPGCFDEGSILTYVRVYQQKHILYCHVYIRKLNFYFTIGSTASSIA